MCDFRELQSGKDTFKIALNDAMPIVDQNNLKHLKTF